MLVTNGPVRQAYSGSLVDVLVVHLIRGMTNRHKVFQVADGDAENVRRKLGLL